jgi:hypothetical protein
MTDLELMQSIKTKWGAAIATACATSSVPEKFLAALIGNESGGNANAKRFERNVLASLWEVLLGRKAAFGSVGRSDLVAYVTGIAGTPVNTPANLPGDAFQRIDALASSWGLTQIMGYHILEGGSSKTIQGLQDPELHLVTALRMLAAFAKEFNLDVTADFSDLLHCWNAGSPSAPTFDPHYVPNAMNRMDAWTSLT